MIRVAVAILGVMLTLDGCVYYNSIYNAERAYAQAERDRREGRDSLAALGYTDAVRGAAQGFRNEPEGPWASQALFVLGRAYLRQGDQREARLALSRARALAPERADSLRIRAFLASTAWAEGDDDQALAWANESLAELRSGEALAEGHLVRARVLLASGASGAGWWDLDRVIDVDPGRRVEATVERLFWAVRLDEPVRAAEAYGRLFAFSEAGARADTISGLTRHAATQWGATQVASFLAPADTAAWARPERDGMRLLRSELLHGAGEEELAIAETWAVAEGFGTGAAVARLRLVQWAVPNIRDLAGARDLRRVLLPAASDPRVSEALGALDDLEFFASLGLDLPIGWFAAAEVARDRLAAPRLARGLFLAYADAQPEDPWAPKALLAALDASPDEGDRAWLRGRLSGFPESPYVRAARGDAAPGFEMLEEQLATRLREIAVR